MELIVDRYDEHEAWSGWWRSLDGKPVGPFVAEHIRPRRASPLMMGERVTVTGMIDDRLCSAPSGLLFGQSRPLF